MLSMSIFYNLNFQELSLDKKSNIVEIEQDRRVAVVIPCYRVSEHILNVISMIGPEVWRIYVVDDACPDKSGGCVKQYCVDTRVKVIYHSQNQGVGGAVMTGYLAAIFDKATIIVKVDGDGQMDGGLIPQLVEPILSGEADYTKGNRFYDLENVQSMPKIRLFGNIVLSLMAKVSSGYWDLFDPTNGFTAIHMDVAKHLPFHKISKRYFFESDILFRLNTLRAVVIDIPMTAKYGKEVSNMKISKIIGEFFIKHTWNFIKRIFYNYYLRDLSLASIELPLGMIMVLFGASYGCYHWLTSGEIGVATPAGTVMLAAMPIIMGLQLVLAFVGYDISSVPKRIIHRQLKHIHKSIKKL
jgi:dolichol-phosphate mannosyltransferase